MSDYIIHSTADMIGEADSMLSRTRASLAPAQPVLCILDQSITEFEEDTQRGLSFHEHFAFRSVTLRADRKSHHL
jgi:hypothetical protein